MACILSSSKVWLELLVRSWNTTLQSSASPIYAQNHTWFEAWKPAQDGLSVVIRQPSVKAQYYALMCLQRWMQGNEILHLNWPERNIDYDVVITSATLQKDYDTIMQDVTVQFFCLTNAFQDTRVSFSYSSTALDMYLTDLIDVDIDGVSAAEKAKQEQSEVDSFIANRKQFKNTVVTFNKDGSINIDVKVKMSYYATTYRYRLFLTYDMMKHLEKGDNTKTYLDSLVANGQASLTSVRHSKVE
jgi:hypothetical protein